MNIEWISVDDRLPEQKGRWSKDDYFCVCKYNYTIGRMRDSVWIDMDNKPIDVVLWMEIPKISDKHKDLW